MYIDNLWKIIIICDHTVLALFCLKTKRKRKKKKNIYIYIYFLRGNLLILQKQLPVCNSISILNFLKMINSLPISSDKFNKMDNEVKD